MPTDGNLCTWSIFTKIPESCFHVPMLFKKNDWQRGWLFAQYALMVNILRVIRWKEIGNYARSWNIPLGSHPSVYFPCNFINHIANSRTAHKHSRLFQLNMKRHHFLCNQPTSSQATQPHWSFPSSSNQISNSFSCLVVISLEWKYLMLGLGIQVFILDLDDDLLCELLVCKVN